MADPMSEMVERVAEALWRDQKRQDDDAAIDYGSVNHKTERDYKVAITVYLCLARAAIAAMREPTHEMLWAGAEAYRLSVGQPQSERFASVWQAMLDATEKTLIDNASGEIG